MGQTQLANRARTLLLLGIDAVETEVRILAGDAGLFPALEISGDNFYAAIVDVSNNLEYVKITARAENVLTVVRGVGGTTARVFSAGSRLELRIIDEAWRNLADNPWHRPKDSAGGVVSPVLVDDTHFYVAGEFSEFFHAQRALNIAQTASGYGVVDSSSYDEDMDRTTVTVSEVALDAGLTLVEVGIDINSVPTPYVEDPTILKSSDIGETVEPANADILKTDTSDLLQAVYGDEAQTHTGTDLSALTVNRNHIEWTLTEASQFSDVTLPYDGTYIFHVYPAGFGLVLAASYKTDGSVADPDSEAGEIRIVIEQYNSRKSIIGLQNVEA